jgi:NarL family two-component system response regulator LiaR
MPSKITVLIAGDYLLVRRAIRALLEAEEDIEVVEEAKDGVQAVNQVAELVPDVVLVNPMSPELDAVGTTRKIRELSPQTKVVVLTTSGDSQQAFKFLKAGAINCVLQSAEPTKLVGAIRCAAGSKPDLFPQVAQLVMAEFFRPGVEVKLTPGEMEVLRLVARGKSKPEVAQSLAISQKKVRAHLVNILSKLHLLGRIEAVCYVPNQGK